MPRAWVRARRTILSADAVSFLAAAILYLLGDRRREGLRVHPRHVDGARPGRRLPLHPPADGRASPGSSPSAAAGSRASAGSSTPAGRRRRIGRRPRARRRRVAAAGSRTGAPHDPRRAEPTTRTMPGRHRRRRAAGRRRGPGRCRRVGRRGGAGRRRAAAGGHAGEAARVPERRVSLAHRLYNGEAGLDVVGQQQADLQDHRRRRAALHRRRWSSAGFNFGIDFAGGNSFRLPGTDASSWPRSATAAEDAGAEVATRADRRRRHRPAAHRRSSTPTSERAVVEAVADAAGVDAGRGQPRVGQRRVGQRHHRPGADRPRGLPRRRGRCSSRVRFQPKMAIGAIAALLHDIIVTAGIYSLIGFEVTPSTVIGFLTILGLLALRHRRRLRQGRREHQGPRPQPPA